MNLLDCMFFGEHRLSKLSINHKRVLPGCTVAQSICTHYSSLSGRPDIFLGSGTKKNQVQNMDLKKAGCKKQGHCYSKREEAAWSFLFLNNNDPGFCTLLFATHILDPFFKVPDPKKISGRPDKLEKWVQIDWTNARDVIR